MMMIVMMHGEEEEKRNFGWKKRSEGMMTHKYMEYIVVLSINKSVELNEKQKVLMSSFDQGLTVNTSKHVCVGI
jgi:hypothetical protein